MSVLGCVGGLEGPASASLRGPRKAPDGSAAKLHGIKGLREGPHAGC